MLALTDKGFEAAIVTVCQGCERTHVYNEGTCKKPQQRNRNNKNRTKWESQNLKIQYLNLKPDWMSLMQSWRQRRKSRLT